MATDRIEVRHWIDARALGAYQVCIVAVCGLLMLVDGFETQAISYVAPMLLRQWHLQPEAMAPVFASALLASVLGYCGVSMASATLGHKRLLMINTAIGCVTIYATAWVQTLSQLILLRFLTGITLGAAIPSLISLACAWTPVRRHATCVFLIYCCYSLGFVAAAIAASTWLVAYGWRAMFWLGGGMALVSWLAAASVLPASLHRRMAAQAVAHQLSSILQRLFPKDRDIHRMHFTETLPSAPLTQLGSLIGAPMLCGTLLLWAIFTLNAGAFYFLQNWLPSILTKADFAPSAVAWITGLSTAGGALSAFVLGPAMDRFNPYPVLAGVYVLAALLLAGLGLAMHCSALVLMATSFCAGFFISGGLKGAIALAALFYPPSLRAVGVGWCLGAGRMGGAVSPLLIGVLYRQHFTNPQIFYLVGVVMLLAALGVAIMAARIRPLRAVAASDTLEDGAARQPQFAD